MSIACLTLHKHTHTKKNVNNIERFTPSLNSSFHQSALRSVPHAWLPWYKCAVCNDFIHKFCPSNTTEVRDGMNISKICRNVIKCKGSTNHFCEFSVFARTRHSLPKTDSEVFTPRGAAYTHIKQASAEY